MSKVMIRSRENASNLVVRREGRGRPVPVWSLGEQASL